MTSSSASFFLPAAPPAPLPDFPVSATCTLQSVTRSRTFFYDRSRGQLVVMDSDSVSTSAQLAIERGWIAPETTQGDCVIREVWLQSLRTSVHGLTVRVAFDFNLALYVERTWTPAEITALVVDGRVTLGVNCHAAKARAVKVTVTETDAVGLAWQPLELLVTYGASAGPRRRSLRQGSLK